jgi:hypothetical protein
MDWQQIADDGNLPIAIKYRIATEAEKEWLAEHGVTIYDIVKGEFPPALSPNIKTLVNAWNLRAEHDIFDLRMF